MQHQRQHQQMGFVGGGGGGGGGLTRFKSAPVSWFDSLLLEEPTEEVVLDNQIPPHGNTSTQCFPQVSNLTNSCAVYDPTPLFHNSSSSSSTFTRHNSSPPQLLASLTSDDLLSFLDVQTTDPTQQQQSLLKGEPSDSFSDMDMEKLFQDSVPCRVRAKRGCATHPRSIAERVRRTRISDRIRKLQELVPNMDKQTNTADMLEEAVEYVKFLQRQIEVEKLEKLYKKITLLNMPFSNGTRIEL